MPLLGTGRITLPQTVAICVVLAFVSLFSLGSHTLWGPPRTSTITTKSKAPLNYRSASFSRQSQDTTSELGRSSNATLGFEKIFVLGFPSRYDKKDMMVLAASLTGIRVEFADGVRGQDVEDRAKPPGMTMNGGGMGCWRGHMNIIQNVVNQNLASAFIFEDDADWDVRLTSQMVNLAKGVRYLSDIPLTARQHSPYGDDWDIIWPGHCGETAPKNDDRKYIIENDETVAPKAHQLSIKMLKDYPEGTRIVHKAGAPICAFGYGISYRGAQKILMELAVRGGPWPIDNAIAFLCRDEALDLKCYSVEPQLINHHRPAGPKSKDSDINGGNKDEIRKKGNTGSIAVSAKLNLEQLIRGTEHWVLQW